MDFLGFCLGYASARQIQNSHKEPQGFQKKNSEEAICYQWVQRDVWEPNYLSTKKEINLSVFSLLQFLVLNWALLCSHFTTQTHEYLWTQDFMG